MIDKSFKEKYIAIKPKGFSYFIWFEKEKTIIESGLFEGKNGWGRGGEHTSIKCNESEIMAVIYSEGLQYL